MEWKGWLFYSRHLTGVALALILFLEIRKGYFKGFGQYLKSLSWESYRLFFLILPVLTALVLFWDVALLHQVQAIANPHIHFIIEFGGHAGKKLWVFIVGSYMVTCLINWERGRRLVFGALLGSALTGLVCYGLKFLFLRARPGSELGSFSFFNPNGLLKDENMFQSLPSGDVAIVAGAVSYFFYACRKHYVCWPLFLLPVSTAFSRVSLNDHWPSDTVLAIGISLIAAQFLRNYQTVKP